MRNLWENHFFMFFLWFPMIFHGFSIFSSFFNGFWIIIGQFQGLPIVFNGFYTFLLSLRYISLEAKRAKGLCHVSWYEKGMRNLWETTKRRINSNPCKFALRFSNSFSVFRFFEDSRRRKEGWQAYVSWIIYCNRCCVRTTNHKRKFRSRSLVWERYEKAMRKCEIRKGDEKGRQRRTAKKDGKKGDRGREGRQRRSIPTCTRAMEEPIANVSLESMRLYLETNKHHTNRNPLDAFKELRAHARILSTCPTFV